MESQQPARARANLLDGIADVLLACDVSNVEGHIEVPLYNVEDRDVVPTSKQRLDDVPAQETTAADHKIRLAHVELRRMGFGCKIQKVGPWPK